jgi:hypothetical protein
MYELEGPHDGQRVSGRRSLGFHWPQRPSHLSKKSTRRTGFPVSPHSAESPVARPIQEADFPLTPTFGGEEIFTPRPPGCARGTAKYF